MLLPVNFQIFLCLWIIKNTQTDNLCAFIIIAGAGGNQESDSPKPLCRIFGKSITVQNVVDLSAEKPHARSRYGMDKMTNFKIDDKIVIISTGILPYKLR